MPKCSRCDFESNSERLVEIHFEAEHTTQIIETIVQDAKSKTNEFHFFGTRSPVPLDERKETVSLEEMFPNMKP